MKKARRMKNKETEADETDCSDNCDCNEEAEATHVDKDKTHAVTRPSASSVDEKAEPSIVFVNWPSELEQIKNDAVQLAVWRQTNPPEFVTTLSSDSSIIEENLPSFKGVVTPGDAYD